MCNKHIESLDEVVYIAKRILSNCHIRARDHFAHSFGHSRASEVFSVMR
jgi:hypothetical protein